MSDHKFHVNWLSAYHTSLTGTNINFYPSPHLLPSLGEIWYKRCAHNSVDHL